MRVWICLAAQRSRQMPARDGVRVSCDSHLCSVMPVTTCLLCRRVCRGPSLSCRTEGNGGGGGGGGGNALRLHVDDHGPKTLRISTSRVSVLLLFLGARYAAWHTQTTHTSRALATRSYYVSLTQALPSSSAHTDDRTERASAAGTAQVHSCWRHSAALSANRDVDPREVL